MPLYKKLNLMEYNYSPMGLHHSESKDLNFKDYTLKLLKMCCLVKFKKVNIKKSFSQKISTN